MSRNAHKLHSDDGEILSPINQRLELSVPTYSCVKFHLVEVHCFSGDRKAIPPPPARLYSRNSSKDSPNLKLTNKNMIDKNDMYNEANTYMSPSPSLIALACIPIVNFSVALRKNSIHFAPTISRTTKFGANEMPLGPEYAPK